MFSKHFIGGQFSWGKINPGKCPLELEAYILPGKTPLRKLPQWATFLGGLFPGGFFPGGIFPSTNLYYGVLQKPNQFTRTILY